MRKYSPLLAIILCALILIALFFLRNGTAVRGISTDEIMPPPAEVENVLQSLNLSVEGSQTTTLRWVADIEDFVSVNLAAQSYGIGFMKKSQYDELEDQLLTTTTREAENDASSDLAAQKGFRASGRACIVGFTFSDSVMNEVAVDVSDREVYSIIVCSRG